MRRLFQEFGQADATVARRYGGTGLGLALSRRPCRSMGGGGGVLISVGQGSVCTIGLPAETTEAPPESPKASVDDGGQRAQPPRVSREGA